MAISYTRMIDKTHNISGADAPNLRFGDTTQKNTEFLDIINEFSIFHVVLNKAF